MNIIYILVKALDFEQAVGQVLVAQDDCIIFIKSNNFTFCLKYYA